MVDCTAERVQAVLLDIEGTVCSISFVRDVLFPYALDVLPSYLNSHWSSPAFQPFKNAFPEYSRESPESLEKYVRELTEKDTKVACLKSLQGLLWQTGYENGSIKAPIYPDVYPAITSWIKEKNLKVAIYSSGSVPAQKLLFRYTDVPNTPNGDMTPLFFAYFDTMNAGMKTDCKSYEKIASETDIEPRNWLFLSDNVREVEAAKAAGMKSIIVVRPGNAALTEEDRTYHEVVENGFGELSSRLGL